MEITNDTPLLTGKDPDKDEDASDFVEVEENGNIAVRSDEKILVTTDNKKTRPVDEFFINQARGDPLSPIKASAMMNDEAAESLDLKLQDSHSGKPISTCVQPESSMFEPPSELEEAMLLKSLDSKLDGDQSQIDLLNESLPRKPGKRTQAEMEPAEFEVPILPKHPHTESPALPAFRDDSEPNIQFSPADQCVFPVPYPGDDTIDSTASKSIQDESVVLTPPGTRNLGETFDVEPSSYDKQDIERLEATFDKDPHSSSAEAASVSNAPQSDVGESASKPVLEAKVETAVKTELESAADAKAKSTGRAALETGASTAENAPAVPDPAEAPFDEDLSLIESIDAFLDPLVRAIFPIMRRGTGLNTAFVCIPVVVASIVFYYVIN